MEKAAWVLIALTVILAIVGVVTLFK